MLAVCRRRNSVQLDSSRRGAGLIPSRLRMSQLVLPASETPSPTSSPSIRRYPQPGFSPARRTTSSRTTLRRRRTTGTTMRIPPAARHQLAMPPQQRRRRHQNDDHARRGSAATQTTPAAATTPNKETTTPRPENDPPRPPTLQAEPRLITQTARQTSANTADSSFRHPHAVDNMLEQWRRERPDLDVTATGVFGRISRIATLVEQSMDLV